LKRLSYQILFNNTGSIESTIAFMKHKITEKSNNKLVIFIFPTPATIETLRVLTKFYSLPFEKVLNPAKEIFNHENLQTGIEKTISQWDKLLDKTDLLIVNFENTPSVFLNIFFTNNNLDIVILYPDSWVNYLLFKHFQRSINKSEKELKPKPVTILKEIDLRLHKLENFSHHCQNNNNSVHLTSLSEIIDKKQTTYNSLLKGICQISKLKTIPDEKTYHKIKTFMNPEERKKQELFDKEIELRDFIGNDKQYYTSHFKI
jgi:hypothetical protein